MSFCEFFGIKEYQIFFPFVSVFVCQCQVPRSLPNVVIPDHPQVNFNIFPRIAFTNSLKILLLVRLYHSYAISPWWPIARYI